MVLAELREAVLLELGATLAALDMRTIAVEDEEALANAASEASPTSLACSLPLASNLNK